MNLPLCFHKEKNFSISINTIGKHFIEGFFSIGDFNISRRFDALFYQPKADVYKFTFTINWPIPAADSFTVFCATLNTGSDDNILNLNWHLVDSQQSTFGSATLFRSIPAKILTKDLLPFPSFSE